MVYTPYKLNELETMTSPEVGPHTMLGLDSDNDVLRPLWD